MIEYRSSVGRTCRRYSESGSLCVVPSDGGPTIGIRWRHSRESRAAPVLRRSGVARGWSRGHRLHRDRPRCADRRCRGKPCEYRGKWSNGSDGHPPFSRPIRRKRGVRNSKFVQAAFDGAAMTIEKLSDVGDAAPREFQSLGRRQESPLAFVQRSEGESHGLLDRRWILGDHGGFLPKGVIRAWSRLPHIPCAKQPECASNATVNKFDVLGRLRQGVPVDLGAGGRRFKSCRPDYFQKRALRRER